MTLSGSRQLAKLNLKSRTESPLLADLRHLIRIVLMHVPVLVIDVHLHVERKADLSILIAASARVEDDLGVLNHCGISTGPTMRHETCPIFRGRMIGEGGADARAHVTAQASSHGRTAAKLRTLDGSSREHHRRGA